MINKILISDTMFKRLELRNMIFMLYMEGIITCEEQQKFFRQIEEQIKVEER